MDSKVLFYIVQALLESLYPPGDCEFEGEAALAEGVFDESTHDEPAAPAPAEPAPIDQAASLAAIERKAAEENEEPLAGDLEIQQLADGMDALAELAHSPIKTLLNAPLPTSLNDLDLELLLTL